MKKGEKVSNKYKYNLICPERTFERYLDDMGVLVVDFFDTRLNQTIGTSKIMMKLYIKRYVVSHEISFRAPTDGAFL